MYKSVLNPEAFLSFFQDFSPELSFYVRDYFIFV